MRMQVDAAPGILEGIHNTHVPGERGTRSGGRSGASGPAAFAARPGARGRNGPVVLLALLPFLVLSACDSGSEPEELRPEAITIAPQSATLIHLGATAQFSARITDQNGDAYDGDVAWSSSDQGIFTVSAKGEVAAAGGGAGKLTASIDDVSATADVLVDQLPTGMVIESGDGQRGTAGSPLSEPLVVRVVDGGGSPAQGIEVTFTAAAGDGSADPEAVETGADGMARASWTLGAGSGIQLLNASLEGGTNVEFAAAAGTLDPAPDSAVYRIVFQATWSAQTHPTDFPAGPHFSPLIGAVHSDRVSFWELGETSSPGMESMAETGATSLLTGEINDEIPANALAVIRGSGSGSPGRVTIGSVVVRLDDPLVTLVTMVAPSPDWFVGVTGYSLLNGVGHWTDERRVVLYPLDAGTDDGSSYSSANDDTSPKEPIGNLRGLRPFSAEQIGTYTITRVDG